MPLLAETDYRKHENSFCRAELFKGINALYLNGESDTFVRGLPLIKHCPYNGEMSEILPHAADYLIYTNPNYVDEFARPKYPAAPITNLTIPVAPVVNEVTIPRHVKILIVEDALRRNEMCPVMFEPITKQNAAVTNCGHVFTLSGINTWLSSSQSKGLCPMCKQCCHVV
jgi:hypothetical protein